MVCAKRAGGVRGRSGGVEEALAALHTQLAAGRLQELLPLVPGGCAKAERAKSDFQLTAGCMCSNSDKAAACPARCRPRRAQPPHAGHMQALGFGRRREPPGGS